MHGERIRCCSLALTVLLLLSGSTAARAVALSRIGKQVVARRSGHHIPLDEPDLVVAAIRDVIPAARR
jgi:hypothetical protein